MPCSNYATTKNSSQGMVQFSERFQAVFQFQTQLEEMVDL